MSSGIALYQSHARLRALHSSVTIQGGTDEFGLTAEPCLIGRLPECHIFISLSFVSRSHAQIEKRGAHFVLLDTSSNGTFVNGQRIRGEHMLHNHDEIGVANYPQLLQFIDQDATDMMPQQLQFNPRERRFTYLHVPLNLPPNLFRLLKHLYDNRLTEEFCTDESCIKAIWPNERLLDNQTELLQREVSELRQKFRAITPQMQNPISRQREAGYRLEIDR